MQVREVTVARVTVSACPLQVTLFSPGTALKPFPVMVISLPTETAAVLTASSVGTMGFGAGTMGAGAGFFSDCNPTGTSGSQRQKGEWIRTVS
jgi:hypothetical protein